MAEPVRDVSVRVRRISKAEIAVILNRSMEDENYDSAKDFNEYDDMDIKTEINDDSSLEEDIISNSDDTSYFAENCVEFSSKDRAVAWTTIPPSNRLSRASSERIIHQRTGVTSFAVQRITELKDSFDLCLTHDMKKDIIRFTNMQGNRIIKNFEEITEIDFNAYLGLLLLIGVYRSYGESVKSLWDETHGRPMMRAVMSLERFLDISRVLTFDDRQSRRSQARGDKLAPIRDFYERWTENLQYLYVANENVTVDEQLIPFRGRCSFKVSMPSKPARYGIKAWITADSATSFCLNFQVYLGDAPEIDAFYNFTKSGVDTMDQMVRTYSCKRRTNRWPVALFSNFIDISALNAFIMWTEIHPNWNSNKLYKRRLFLQSLGERLVRPYIIQRNHIPRSEASAAIVRTLQAEESTSSTSSPPPAKKLKASERKRCKFCIPNREKKTFTVCSVCNKPVCPTHRHTTTITNTYCEQHIP